MLTIRMQRQRLLAAALSLMTFLLLPMQAPEQIAVGQSKFIGSTINFAQQQGYNSFQMARQADYGVIS